METISIALESSTSTGQASVNFVQDQAASTPTRIVFHPDPSGTCSVVFDATQLTGCTNHARSTSCSLIADGSSLVVAVDASTDPPTYRYSALVEADVMLHRTINCPGVPPVESDSPSMENLMTAPEEKAFKVAADGKTLQGTHTDGSAPASGIWTWDLTLHVPPAP